MYAKIFQERIKVARTRIGLKQEEVASETGIARTNISKYENGKQEPSIEQLGTLADFYGVSLDWLIGTAGKNPYTN